MTKTEQLKKLIQNKLNKWNERSLINIDGRKFTMSEIQQVLLTVKMIEQRGTYKPLSIFTVNEKYLLEKFGL